MGKPADAGCFSMPSATLRSLAFPNGHRRYGAVSQGLITVTPLSRAKSAVLRVMMGRP